MDYIKNKQNAITAVFITLIIISVSFFVLYYSYGAHLAYGDAVSRLNISRKIVDNLTPGFAQLGNVWLPFPQLLMVPFILSSGLWHSGIAGAIVSMFSYVFGGYFIFKSAQLLTKSSFASFFALAIYALNINILYFQTTAMSEPIFILFLSAIIYFFISWAISGKVTTLMMLAGSVAGLTLTRYEGLAVLLSSIVMVGFYSFLKNRKWSQAEGDLIIFSVLACLGFALWTLYLAVIFGDPLYWIHYYAGGQTTSDNVVTYAVNLGLIDAVKKYFVTMIWMNGLIPMIFAILGTAICIFVSIKRKIIYTLPLLIPLSIYMFMVLTLMRNTPINQPDFNLKNILTPLTNNYNEFNIRYGLIMLPIIAVITAYLAKFNSWLFRGLLIGLLCIQIISYFNTKFTIIYQIPYKLTANGQQTVGNDSATLWLKSHYDGGLILVSALKHDPSMFRLGINYNNYIHEGTQKYWSDSLTNPQKYATWIFMFSPSEDNSKSSDPVTKYVGSNPNLAQYFDKVYSGDSMSIYRIKTKPEIKI